MVDVRRIYIDSCCFIDMVKAAVGKILTEDKELDVWFLERLLEAHRDNEIAIFTSTLTIAECSHAGEGDVSDKVKSEFSRLLMSGQYVRLVQTTLTGVPTLIEQVQLVSGFCGVDLMSNVVKEAEKLGFFETREAQNL